MNTVRLSHNRPYLIAILLLTLFTLGLFLYALLWSSIYLRQSVRLFGAVSIYLSPTDMTALLNQDMTGQGDELLRLGQSALARAGYSGSYARLMLGNIHWSAFVVPLLFAALYGLYIVLSRRELRAYEREASRLAAWAAGSDDRPTGMVSLLPLNVVESIQILKRQIERLSAIHKEDNARILHYMEDISHQLKAPLAVIRAACERAAMTWPDTEQSMEVSLTQVDKLTELIGQLLLLGRFDCGGIKANFSFVSPAAILETLADDHALLLQEHGMTLQVSDVPDEPWFCDEFWLRQALDNIVVNAIRHGRPGGTIGISCDTTERENHICIWDDGDGFENGTEKVIFERYVSHDRAGREGAGLGLAIARQAVELHFGSITAANRPQGGAEFHVRFPRLDPDAVYRAKKT